MNEQIKLGVIGTGGIFKYAHIAALVSHSEVKIAAVCDRNLADKFNESGQKSL